MKAARMTEAYFFKNGQVFNFDHVSFSSRSPVRTYTQEFGTVFWVHPGGTGVYRANGHRLLLRPGMLVMQRPKDRVQIQANPGPVELIISRGLVPRAALESLRQRYFPSTPTFFWKTTPLPYNVKLNAAQREWLASWNKALYNFQTNQMMVDLFLLGLFAQLEPPPKVDLPACPSWLHHALEAVSDPAHFRGGAPAFVRLAGRSRKHVNRVLRQCYGLTATAVVNRARMEHAAHELLATEKKILDICAECGFQNLGHFYRVFENYHKATPRQYRQSQHFATPERAVALVQPSPKTVGRQRKPR
ncbi:MAG: HTH-type transcriptional activator RhaS [Verrucomicrobiae bacterium]|nr:HTH-type transcriptional activator RhaS [Verrucomicrobiae bacterium]